MFLRALIPALAALALAAPSALADSEWSLVFEAQGSIDVKTASKTDDANWRSTDDHGDFSWRSEMHGIRFDDEGRLVAGGQGTSTFAGKGRTESHSVVDGKDYGVTCGYGGAAATYFDYVPKVTADSSIAGPDAKEVLAVSPFDYMSIDIPCTGYTGYPFVSKIGFPISSLGQTRTNHPYGALITMPKDALAQGKVIHVVESFAPRANHSCLTHTGFECSLVWKGTITLTRKQYAPPAPGPDDDVAPLPPPLPAPPADLVKPAPAPAPPAADDDLLFPLVPETGPAKLDASGRTASTTVTCGSGCSGTMKAFAAGGSPRAVAAAARALATKRFTAKPGRPTKVTVRLSPRARRAVKRAGGVRLVLDLRPKGGKPVRRVVGARLK
jgi:hypothetical protein